MHGFMRQGLALLALVSALVAATASLAQTEKRVALVIGNSAYQQGPLATAANDAGLIAQTLQAAGFDVVGARDLDGDTLRHAIRDFVQKAASSGPDTVAVVYLAGYGLQMSGENYFVPVDANIANDADVPVEAVRVSDYMRQLAALPMRVGIFVLDAARASPFQLGGQPLAGGLALVEPDAKLLVAFNAAPGTIGPEEQGPYGAYAQALAEMIRQGGMPLPEVFNRVRLRVNDVTHGAEVPWNAQKIQTSFVFFERAADAPQAAPPEQVAEIRMKPIRDFDARDAYIAALERDTLQAYEEFLMAFPRDPLAARVRAIVAARREAITWRRTYRGDTPNAYWSYLRRYPNGPHAWDARRRLAALAAALEPPPAFAVFDYDVPPPPPAEIVYVDRPVIAFYDPVYAFAPPPPPPLFFLPPPEPEFILLPPPPPPLAVFALPVPLFVAMPTYVRAPSYVAPPPNNIIYANIHNTTVINTVINQPPASAPASAPPTAAGPRPDSPRPPPSAAATASVGPALPPAAVQKANLIQQGLAPVPGRTAPTTTPGQTPQANLPAVPPPNKLQPLPGAAGQPLPAPATAPTNRPGSATVTPTPVAPTPGIRPGAIPPTTPGAPAAAPTTRPGTATVTPPPVAPTPGIRPGAIPSTTPGAPSANLPSTTPAAPKPGQIPAQPRPTTPSAALPPAPATAPSTPAVRPPGPPPATQHAPPPPPPAQTVNRPPPPASVTRPPPPPPVVNRPTPPPAVVNRPPPPPAVVNRAPPPPAVVNRPPPPPPVVNRAPPPPPPVVNRPPPPPPPVAARPPPPPPAAARPAAPAPAAAAKKCPPNVPPNSPACK